MRKQYVSRVRILMLAAIAAVLIGVAGCGPGPVIFRPASPGSIPQEAGR